MTPEQKLEYVRLKLKSLTFSDESKDPAEYWNDVDNFRDNAVDFCTDMDTVLKELITFIEDDS